MSSLSLSLYGVRACCRYFGPMKETRREKITKRGRREVEEMRATIRADATEEEEEEEEKGGRMKLLMSVVRITRRTLD